MNNVLYVHDAFGKIVIEKINKTISGRFNCSQTFSKPKPFVISKAIDIVFDPITVQGS